MAEWQFVYLVKFGTRHCRLNYVGVGYLNEVVLRRARPVLGWVNIWVQLRLRKGLPWYVTSRFDQLSLAVLPWVGAMSIG